MYLVACTEKFENFTVINLLAKCFSPNPNIEKIYFLVSFIHYTRKLILSLTFKGINMCHKFLSYEFTIIVTAVYSITILCAIYTLTLKKKLITLEITHFFHPVTDKLLTKGFQFPCCIQDFYNDFIKSCIVSLLTIILC